MNQKGHNQAISIAKGLGIILMVVGHSGAPSSLGRFIYMFHMPLFFFISGYLFKEKYFEAKKSFVKKRIKGLYIPFIKWSLIFLLFHNLLAYFQIYNNEYTINEFTNKVLKILTLTGSEQLLGGYWFLKELLFASIISLFLLFIISKIFRLRLQERAINNIGYSLFVTLVLFLLLAAYFYGNLINSYPAFKIPAIGTVTILATAYYITGYLYSKIKININIYISICLLILVLVFSFVSEVNYSIEIIGWQIFLYYLFSTIAILGVINICRNFKGALVKFFDYVGIHTLQILTWHFLSFKLVSLLKISIYDLPMSKLAEFPIISDSNSYFWIVYIISGVGIPLIGCVIYDIIKLKLIKK